MKNRILLILVFPCMTVVLYSSEIYSVDYRFFELKYSKNEIYKYSIWDHTLESPTTTINPSVMYDDDFLNIVRQAKGLHKGKYDYSLDLVFMLDRKKQRFILGVKVDRETESLFYPYIYKHDYLSFIKKVIDKQETSHVPGKIEQKPDSRRD